MAALTVSVLVVAGALIAVSGVWFDAGEARAPAGVLPAVEVVPTPPATVTLGGPVLACPLPREKKVLLWSWYAGNIPAAQELLNLLPSIQSRPFDGLVFRPGAGGCCGSYGLFFRTDPHPQTPEEEEELYHHATLAQLAGQWGRYTDNFMYLRGGTAGWPNDFDLFDDASWNNTLLPNIALWAHVAADAQCVGLMLDIEFYTEDGCGFSAWSYIDHCTGAYRFKDPKGNPIPEPIVRQRFRERGVQCIQAIQTEMPHVKLMTSVGWPASHGDPNSWGYDAYYLYDSFLAGLLEGLNPGATLIDGDEGAYYVGCSEDFLNRTNAAHGPEGPVYQVVPVELREKFLAQYKAAHAVYVDKLCAQWCPGPNSGWCYCWLNPPYWTQSDSENMYRHNVYYAMGMADEYAWLYTETANWLDPNEAHYQAVFVNDGGFMLHASPLLESTRALYEAGGALGYDLNGCSHAITVLHVTMEGSGLMAGPPPNARFVQNTTHQITVRVHREEVGDNRPVTHIVLYENGIRIMDASGVDVIYDPGTDTFTATYNLNRPFGTYEYFARALQDDPPPGWGRSGTSAPYQISFCTDISPGPPDPNSGPGPGTGGGAGQG